MKNVYKVGRAVTEKDRDTSHAELNSNLHLKRRRILPFDKPKIFQGLL